MASKRETIRRLLSGDGCAERVGLMEAFWKDTLAKWVTQGYPTEKDAATGEDAPVKPVDHFDLDIASVGGWFNIHPHPGVSELVEETDEWELRRDGAGATLKVWKHKSGTPEHVDFHIKNRRIWDEEYRPHVLELDRKRVDVETAKKDLARRREQGFSTQYGHVFIYQLLREFIGDVCMCESFLLDPEWIHDFNRVYTDFFKMHFKLLFDEAGVPDAVWLYEDLGYKKGLFCSPRLLKELIFPYYREIIEFFHAYGLFVVLHSCGSTTEALPMITEVGFDGLHPMERAAGNDPLQFAEQYGDRIAFFGGLDKRLVETHDKALIRKEATALIEGMKARGARYIFASDHSISPNTDYDDYRYMLDVYREHMAY